MRSSALITITGAVSIVVSFLIDFRVYMPRPLLSVAAIYIWWWFIIVCSSTYFFGLLTKNGIFIRCFIALLIKITPYEVQIVIHSSVLVVIIACNKLQPMV